MRIDAFNKISQIYKTSNTKISTKVKEGSFRDMLDISQTGKDYQVAKKIVSNTPDIREDRVNDIKQRIASATYNISAKEVADKLVENYFDEMI